VNAGAVHSYVWTPEGRTAYITDLEVGTQVLAVNTAGVARPVLVGRVKTEVRPLRLIVAEAGGTRVNVLLQDDWHVRIFDANGEVRNCSTIEPGDKLLSHICEPGRHVGIKVEETISEW
jgi:3-amino-4-hydroxybenzoic acid synthase